MHRLPSWEDLRLFLAVARQGRFIAAGRVIGVDHTTVARRIGALEAALGARLVERSPRGVTLTGAGEALFAHAERMEAEAYAAAAALGSADAAISGVVRLSTPEALGTVLIAPKVKALADRHPELTLELVPESRLVSLVNREADIAILLNRPPRGRIVARRLIDYRVGLYAARGLLEATPAVRSLGDLSGRPFIGYIDTLLDMPELGYLHDLAAEARMVFRSSSVVAQHAAIAAGLGFGMLHAFAADADPRLARVLPEIEVTRTYWIAFHADQQRLPRVRAVVEFIDGVAAENRRAF